MKKEHRKAIILISAPIVLSSLVAYLFSGSGPIASYFSLDLSFLIAPGIIFFVALFGSKLVLVILPRFNEMIVSHIFDGVLFSIIAYTILSFVKYYPELQDSVPPQLKEIDVYVILFIMGITIYRLANLFEEEANALWAKPVTQASGLLLTGYSAYSILQPFGSFADQISMIGTSIFIGFSVGAVASLASYGKQSAIRFLADACHLAARHHLQISFLGAFLYSYFQIIRPYVTEEFQYAPLVEWGIVFLVVWLVYRGVKLQIKDRYSTPLKLSGWEKHAQQVDITDDPLFVRLEIIQKEFVERGRRQSFLVNLIVILHENGLELDDIGNALVPLINYQDMKIPWYAFFWDQKRVDSKNESARNKVLNDIMDAIIQPTKIMQESMEVKE